MTFCSPQRSCFDSLTRLITSKAQRSPRQNPRSGAERAPRVSSTSRHLPSQRRNHVDSSREDRDWSFHFYCGGGEIGSVWGDAYSTFDHLVALASSSPLVALLLVVLLVLVNTR